MSATQIKESMKIVPEGMKKCIWMEAGVVTYKLCDNNYDCSTCSYDMGLQKQASKNQDVETRGGMDDAPVKISETWVGRMMKLPASQRKCRYMMTGEIDRKLCANAYECGSCSFDQMMQERLQAEPLSVQAPAEVAGFQVVDGFYYHEGHTWARPEYGGRLRVGLDDFARKLIGSKTRVDLPSVGQKVKQGEPGFSIRRNGQTIDVLAPSDGVVSHVNQALVDHPELLHDSPYDQGWLFTVEPVKLRKNLKNMYFGDEARAYFSEEKDKLFNMVHEDLRIAADGGEAVEDIADDLDEAKWAKLVKAMLKS